MPEQGHLECIKTVVISFIDIIIVVVLVCRIRRMLKGRLVHSTVITHVLQTLV